MDKDTARRWLRLIGIICTIILAVIGALGIDVPSLQDSTFGEVVASLVAVVAGLANHWYNNNYTVGAKIAQPSIKEINDSIKDEADAMGRGDDNE